MGEVEYTHCIVLTQEKHKTMHERTVKWKTIEINHLQPLFSSGTTRTMMTMATKSAVMTLTIGNYDSGGGGKVKISILMEAEVEVMKTALVIIADISIIITQNSSPLPNDRASDNGVKQLPLKEALNVPTQ